MHVSISQPIVSYTLLFMETEFFHIYRLCVVDGALKATTTMNGESRLLVADQKVSPNCQPGINTLGNEPKYI